MATCCHCAIGQTNEISESKDVQSDRQAFIIPVEGVIEKGLLYVLRRGVAEAEEMGATDIILHMNTPGGVVTVAEEIIRLLIALPEDITTYTFIDKDALSAGSCIALATERIYMSPGSRIGASAIVTAAGDIEEGDLKEKHVSALVALVSGAAERKGHDKNLAEVMIRREAEYKIGDEVICPEGKLLTLTDIDAERVVERDGKSSPLLSEGTVDSIEDLLKELGIDGEKVTTLEITWAEGVARWIELFGPLFLIGGVLGLYIEFKIPGFGLPGVAGLTCLAIFFWGHNVAGLAGMEELIIFFLGMLLIAIEIFVIPGFGLTGILGTVLIFTAIVMAMVQHYPGGSWTPPEIQAQAAIRNIAIFLVMSFFAIIILARYLPRTSMFQRLMLSKSEDRKDGFRASRDTAGMVGQAGIADTSLHPAGIGIFGDDRVNVVTRGEFIENGSPIVVAEAHGHRIVVEEKIGKYVPNTTGEET
jgi:membrane-bound serine protease (ClpP class)